VSSYLGTYEEKSGEELKEAELYDHTGNSIIHKAASLGHAEVLMLLLERTGATPDLVNASLATPLHLACKNDRLDAAKFLIGCGVDANMQDEHGQVPLLISCIHGHFDLARMLIEANGSGHLPEPLEVDLKDHRGLSPLNCAAIKGDFDMAKLLIINGQADIDGASPKGCTPLLYAARGGYAEVVRFLLLRGASPLRQDNAGGTVLHHAIEKGHIEVLLVLLEHGVDVHSAIEIPDNAGRTPIYEAIDNHETPEMLLMITKSRKLGGFEANVNISNYSG
jgi:ankyrin repeat protein